MEKPAEKKNGSDLPFYQRKEFLPLALFGGFLLFLILSTAFSGPPPVIGNVFQEDNLTYDIVTIEGKNFGPQSGGGEVRIGDLALTQSNYLKWSEDKIIVTIPREISSGIIYVVTKNGHCRGDIYINPDEIPRLTSYHGPLINSVSPDNTSPGEILVIRGERFGKERGMRLVSFSMAAPSDSLPEEKNFSNMLISASDAEFEYVLWSDREIQVRVPDGAKSGMVVVSAGMGMSNPKYITVISPFGKKQFGKKSGYTLRWAVEISNVEASSPNTLYLWIPEPPGSPEQRNIEKNNFLQAPLISPFAGVQIYKLMNLKNNDRERISIDYTLDRYSITTEIDPLLVTANYDKNTAFYKALTADDEFVKPSHPALAGLLWTIAPDEKNPFLAARKIYDYIVREFSFDTTSGVEKSVDWYACLEKKKGDAYIYANLFTALVRKAGIPARLVAGYFIDGTQTAHTHFWSEFYLEGFGWVPVDPLLGDDKKFGDSPAIQNPAVFYFGNLDSRHIAIAKGCVELQKMNLQDTTVFQRGIPSLQSFHEEADANLSHYQASWSDLLVLDVH
jgi:hypothetical protein